MNEARRLLLCKDPSVNAACPQTCGTCCEDSTTYVFERDNGLNATCLWLAEKENRIQKYCVEYALKANNGRTVRDGCPVTCTMCKSEVSSVTEVPTVSSKPSAQPNAAPSGKPSSSPTGKPSAAPSAKPSASPTDAPSRPPSPMPSPFPTSRPSFKPSQSPSDVPSTTPSDAPSLQPSQVPSDAPSAAPSDAPSLTPSAAPSSKPSQVPSAGPSSKPSQVPSLQPSNKPTQSIKPSATPSKKPSPAPATGSPVAAPTGAPSGAPVSTSCVNTSYTFPLINDATETKDCLWIIKNGKSVANRRTNYCSIATIGANCKQACGLCATPTDSPTFIFKLKNFPTFVNCAWITKNADPVRTEARKEYCTRANVQAGCAATCA